MLQPPVKLIIACVTALLILFGTLLYYSQLSTADRPEELTTAAAQADPASGELPEIAWIDVRSSAEYQLDHINGDPRIPHTEIVDGVTALYPDKSTPIRLYCASGGRAGKAAKMLNAAGYSDVVNAGGIDEVRKSRFDTDSGKRPANE